MAAAGRVGPLFALLLLAAAAPGGAVSPVQKVVMLLQDMQAKAKQEKQDEAVEFAKFNQFCGHEQEVKAKEIKQAGESIESLSAEIEKLRSDSTVLGQDLAALGTELDKVEADKKAQTLNREKERTEFEAAEKDYGESLDALDRAIIVLKRRLQDVKQPGGAGAAAALMQFSKSFPKLPSEAKRMITAFAQMSKAAQDPDDDDAEGLAVSAPEANAYEFQSGGIIDMLEGLKDKFRKEKSDLEKEEMNSKHAFEMMLQDLEDSIERNKDETLEKSAEKSKKDEQAAADSKELQATTADRDEDTKYLSDLKAECEQKSASFEEKQQLRSEEIEAVGQAIEILQGAASSASEKHLSLLVTKGSSLAQLRASHGKLVGQGTKQEPSTDEHFRVARFLADEARRLKSHSLGLLAHRVQESANSGADPFAKVKSMIEAMITRLLKEGHEEAEQKGFCDKELSTNKITRDKLTTTIDTLAAECEGSQALIAKLGEEITQLTQELAELDQAVQTYTEDREAERAKNKLVIQDAQDAQKAVDAARAVLKDFYEKAAGATALMQQEKEQGRGGKQQETMPKMGSDEWNSLANPSFDGTVDKGHKKGQQTFGEAYKGQQDAAGNVLAFLEVIQSDFANLEADTKAADKAAEKAFTAFKYDSDKSKAVKSKDVEMKTADQQATEAKLQSDTKDLKATQDELLAAERYYDKLKPHCLAEPQSYDDRVAARKEEIESLREALRILSGTDIA